MNSPSTFLRFCAVGTVGFAVDSGLLSLFLALGGGVIGSRILSSLIAIFVTFTMNRYWAFQSGGARPFSRSLMEYVGVQSAGWVVNVTVYGALVRYFPYPLSIPVVAVMFGSAAALILNYFGAVKLVFRK